tara:strand:+ start:4853 stop:6004 length:1152 start_codon:yes stop_codon:yes gene_type:complete
MKISERSKIPPFYALEVFREANALESRGVKVIHLETGEPGSRLPNIIAKAANDALKNKKLGYTESLGLPELRMRIANHYLKYYGIKIPYQRIVITTGSSAGLLLSIIAAFNVGDKIAICEPGYPAYRNMVKSLGGEIVTIPTNIENGFQLNVSLLEKLDTKINGLIVASPANPTGSMLENKEVRNIANWCIDNEVQIISDEIYHGITYDNKANSFLEFNPNTIVTNGFSKYFAMTGWRIGWLVLPDELTITIEKLLQNLYISAPTISQYAALKAFDCSNELEQNILTYKINRDILYNSLKNSGFGKICNPNGAFYLYAHLGQLSKSSEDFCKKMLEEAHVAATPGIDFDKSKGCEYVRFSYAGETKNIKIASLAINKWIQSKK